MKLKVSVSKKDLISFLTRHRWQLGIAGAVIALYGAVGFWVLPGIVQEQLVQKLSVALDRPVKLGELRINPYALSVTAGQFSIEERDGSTLAAFDELYINFSLSSAVRFAWTFSEIRLTNPKLAVVLAPNGSLNLAQLGAKQVTSVAEAPTDSEASVPRVVIGELTVVNGQVGFEDRRGKKSFASSVDAINFSLRDFSTLPDDHGLHAFSAATDLGERLAWRGRIGVNPLQSQGQLELTEIRVPRLTDYLLAGDVKVTEGVVDLVLDYDVRLLPAGTTVVLNPSRFALRDVRASLVTTGTALTPLNLEFSPITLKVSGLSGNAGSKANIELAMVPNGKGEISVRGTLGLNPQTADLQISVADIALAPFQTLVEPAARLRLERGALQVEGRFELGAAKPGAMRFTGNAAIRDFSSLDPAHGQSFARWRALQLDDIRFDAGNALSIARISLQDPYLRVAIDTNRISNLQHILGGEVQSSPAEKVVAPNSKPAAAATTALRSRIGLITVRNGSAYFSDESLQPNFATGLQDLNGTIKGLSSQSDARATVELLGKVDRYAPVTIKGEINPLAAQAYTDIGLRFENIELTTFTPYSGKFASRRIDKGKLSLDLRYKLDQRQLIGENKIVLDQFTLGERVQSPDAMDLPLELAIAILKDTRGVIDIDMPVRGNLDEPDFGYGKLVLQALRNLIMKALTAPFSLLAASMGGGEEMGYVVFAPGRGELSAAEQAKLDKLAGALANRPSLTLEIRGATADEADRLAIATVKLLRRDRSVPPDAPLSPSEQRRLLDLYNDKFGDSPITGKDERAVEQARQKLAATVAITPGELQELARNRGLAIGEYLVTRANVAKERVFLGNPGADAKAGSEGVRVELKLGMR